MNGKKMKNLRNLWKMNLLRQIRAHRPNRCGRKRWHH
jgi:hypothetical protein